MKIFIPLAVAALVKGVVADNTGRSTESVQIGLDGDIARHLGSETFLEAVSKMSDDGNETETAEALQNEEALDGPSLVVGGQEAARGAFPYYVDIFPDGTAVCGGSLIAPKVVLTAQHCNTENGVITFNPTFVGRQVRIGAVDQVGATDGSRLVTVVEQKSHPSFRAMGGLQNDFLLLLLAEEVDIENQSPKLRLSNLDSDISPGTTLRVIGLGATVEGGAPAPTLQEAQVRAFDDFKCLEDYVSSTVLTPFPGITFCAGFDEGGVDACQGDSGGPIVFEDGDIHYQTGVVSYGEGCARADRPGIYARIAGNDEGFGFIFSTVCDDWEEVASFCGGNECDSDCDCNVGFECECLGDSSSSSSSSDDRRFLSAFQKQLFGSNEIEPAQKVEDKEPAYARLVASSSGAPPRVGRDPQRRIKSGKSNKSSSHSSKSDKCKSVKGCKSSKGDGPYCLSSQFPDVPRDV